MNRKKEFDALSSQCRDIADHLSSEACASFEERTENLLRNYELLTEEAVKAVEVAETDVDSFVDECRKLTEWLADVKKFLQPKADAGTELMSIGDELERCRVRRLILNIKIKY